MKRLCLFLALALFASIPARADWTFTVTDSITAITSTQNGPFSVLIRENSASPSAVFTIYPGPTSPAVGATGTVTASGSIYQFLYPGGAPVKKNQILGYISASTSGPFTFVAITSNATAGSQVPFVGDIGNGGRQGLVPAPGAGDAAANKFLSAAGSFETVADSAISFTDITTGNCSTSKHGFAPKGDGNTAHFLNGNCAWATPAGGGGGSPGGANTNVQYNDSSAFGGDGNLTWDKTNQTLTITGSGDPLALSVVGHASFTNAVSFGTFPSYGSAGQHLRSNGGGAADAWTDPVTIGDTVGGSTAGSVLFVGTGPVLAQDNAGFHYDGAGGLATTAFMEVDGATGAYSNFNASGNLTTDCGSTGGCTVDWEMDRNGNKTWAFEDNLSASGDHLTIQEGTNNTNKIEIIPGTAGEVLLNQSGGNVGIGVAPGATTAKLDVVGPISFGPNWTWDDTNQALSVTGNVTGSTYTGATFTPIQATMNVTDTTASTWTGIGGDAEVADTNASGTISIGGNLNSSLTVTGTSPAQYATVGAKMFGNLIGGNLSGTPGAVGAYAQIINNSGSSTISHAYDILAASPNNSGTITDYQGVHINNPAGAGTLTSACGLCIDNQGVSNYAIKTGTGILSAGDTVTLAAGTFHPDTSVSTRAAFNTSAVTGARVVTVPDANSTLVVPDAGASNNFLTAISASGAISKAQPTYSNISGGTATFPVGTKPGFLYSNDATGQVAAIGDTTMVTPGADGMYRFSGTVNCTTTSAAAVASLNIKYKDTGGASQTTSVTDTCTALVTTGVPNMEIALRAKAGTAITWGVSITNTPTYDVSVRLEVM